MSPKKLNSTQSKPVRKYRKRKNNQISFSIYIHRVLKQVMPNESISKKAMDVMNSFVIDIFERIATEASKLASRNGRLTLKTRDVRSAVRLLLPGELAVHADGEGMKCEGTHLFMKSLQI